MLYPIISSSVHGFLRTACRYTPWSSAISGFCKAKYSLDSVRRRIVLDRFSYKHSAQECHIWDRLITGNFVWLEMSNRKPSEDLSQKPSMILEKQVKPKVANPSEDPRVSYLRQIYFSQQYLEKLLSKSYYIKWKGMPQYAYLSKLIENSFPYLNFITLVYCHHLSDCFKWSRVKNLDIGLQVFWTFLLAADACGLVNKFPIKLESRWHLFWRHNKLTKFSLAGFDRADEPLGQACLLCENDLSRSPEQVEMELEVYDFSEVAVLACGHSFHLKCFELAVSLELMDPECFICGSMH